MKLRKDRDSHGHEKNPVVISEQLSVSGQVCGEICRGAQKAIIGAAATERRAINRPSEREISLSLFSPPPHP